ncbi:DNA integrity scanning protein DisA [Planctomycetes bacterium Poly30]|uniref:Diadenylate cyclase n=1 Tax=Saltatorellus ferox TaxID=2528018 RepID=A0A518EQE0_9BACT|nr:DNA integrity scanning protein DisA [Planctomycetes bacterium Poly30]
MLLDPKTIGQILVLTVGSHIVLSFLRTTRGSGLIRGVVIALIVVFGALLGVARWLGLSELQFIVEGVTGFAVVILAIVFQPELRRGIISLGDNPLLSRVIGSRAKDVVDEVASACVSMAKRKRGALIAFERQTPLDPWTQTAQRVDARVNRFLLDSIFHTDSALHDGAVIIREDRIAAAGAILPLSENDRLAQSVGTRHRAALGLSEETDAVVVAVSEETGLITVCQNGKMERRVLRDELGAVLRSRLGGDDDVKAGKDGRHAGGRFHPVMKFLKGLIANPGQKAMALAVGVGLFLLAFRSIRTSKEYTLEVRVEAGEDAKLTPTRGILRIVLPSRDLHLASPRSGDSIMIDATAAQADLALVGGELGGVLIVTDDWVGTEKNVRPGEITWGVDRPIRGLDVDLRTPGGFLAVRVERYDESAISPTLASFGGGTAAGSPLDSPVEASLIGIQTPIGAELDTASVEFNPGVVTVRGPKEDVARLTENPALLAFEPIDLSRSTGTGFVVRLVPDREAMEARQLGEVMLGEELFLRGRLLPRETVVGQLELEVALVSFDAAAGDAAPRFLPPTETVTAFVKTRGLISDGIDESLQTTMRLEILQFVRENARVFVDTERAAASPGLRTEVEVGSLDPLWRASLGPLFGAAKENPGASLRLELDESDRTVALTRAPEEKGQDE